MRKSIYFVALLSVFLFLGCSITTPSTMVRTMDDRPTLAIKGASEIAMLYVDGLSMGLANQYNGEPNTLAIEPGTHLVRVVVNNNVIYEQKVFVEGSLKTITVR
jgi:hypothetical protein